MSGTNLEDVVEKLKSAIESIDNISVTTDTESALKDSGLVDAINSISVSLAAKLMPSALARMMERIEGALIAKQKLDELSVRIKDEQFGYQDTDGDGMFKRIDVVSGGFRDDTLNTNRF